MLFCDQNVTAERWQDTLKTQNFIYLIYLNFIQIIPQVFTVKARLTWLDINTNVPHIYSHHRCMLVKAETEFREKDEVEVEQKENKCSTEVWM